MKAQSRRNKAQLKRYAELDIVRTEVMIPIEDREALKQWALERREAKKIKYGYYDGEL